MKAGFSEVNSRIDTLEKVIWRVIWPLIILLAVPIFGLLYKALTDERGFLLCCSPAVDRDQMSKPQPGRLISGVRTSSSWRQHCSYAVGSCFVRSNGILR